MATQSPSPSSGESLSIRVVREVAAHDGVDPMDLSPPLFHSVDPAALDALFEPTSTDDARAGRVTFAYDGKRIAVDSDGEVTIDPERDPQRTCSR
ncbi:HalOD1 output domain-containing protein [Haloterrigena gelatinilytica]|nr:HalOD1 output domain-containing protein [Haloterrigena gelatinilytica]